MRTYEIIKRAISLRNREVQEVAAAVGISREHLSRYVNGRSPNFAQVLVDKLFEELGLKIVIVMDDVDVLLKGNWVQTENGTRINYWIVIQKLAKDLKSKFPDIKGLFARNLGHMKSFVIAWPDDQFLHQLDAKIP